MSQRGVDMLKEFSERHEADREPFPQWRTRKLQQLSQHIWIIEMSRARAAGFTTYGEHFKATKTKWRLISMADKKRRPSSAKGATDEPKSGDSL